MNKKIQIFKEEPGFLKLFSLFKEKYRSLGRIGGNVSIRSFNREELESIAGFLGVPTEKVLQKGSIGLVEFEKELAHTGFKEYSLLHLIEEVLKESILTKKEELEQAQIEEKEFLASIRPHVTSGGFWLDWIEGRPLDTRWIWSLYKQDKEGLRDQLILVCKAFSLISNMKEYERLPFFSQRVSGNPHCFDPNETAGKLLLHCLYVDQIQRGNEDAAIPKKGEDLNDFLAEYHLMRDDLWNFVTCQGLLAATAEGIDPVWQSAIDTQTIMNVPIKELKKVTKIWPAKGKQVWIVENSSVCSTIMDAVPSAPIICTHGQLRAASWQLLESLVQSECTLLYSGDLDPEGIIIANKLKKRFKHQLVLWRMDCNSYEASISNEDISSRFSKVESLVCDVNWSELITVMRNFMKAGYQEAIVFDLINDIKESIG